MFPWFTVMEAKSPLQLRKRHLPYNMELILGCALMNVRCVQEEDSKTILHSVCKMQKNLWKFWRKKAPSGCDVTATRQQCEKRGKIVSSRLPSDLMRGGREADHRWTAQQPSAFTRWTTGDRETDSEFVCGSSRNSIPTTAHFQRSFPFSFSSSSPTQLP